MPDWEVIGWSQWAGPRHPLVVRVWLIKRVFIIIIINLFSSAVTSLPEERVHLFDGAIWSSRDPEDKGCGQNGCGQEPKDGYSVNTGNGCGQDSNGSDAMSRDSPVDDIVTNGSNHGNTTPSHTNCHKRNTNEHHHDDDDVTLTPNKVFKQDTTDS